MENFKTKINTLNSLLPQTMPFVIGQVSKAIKMCCECEEDVANRNLDIAIAIAEQVKTYSQGELLYNYKPIVIALLKDVENPNLEEFDTVEHEIPLGLSYVKQFLDTYSNEAKTASSRIAEYVSHDDVCMVILANMLADIKAGMNVLTIAYIITCLNFSKVQFVNGTFKFYCDILGEIGKANF